MQVEATHVGSSSEWSPADIVRAVRSALLCLESRVESVRVDVASSGDAHVCRLRARTERGHVVVVECRATRLGEAIESAADGLERALERARRASPPARAEDAALPVAPHVRRREAPSRQAEAARARLLLAAGGGDASGAALHWAGLLASALQADLDVYRWRAREEAPMTPTARLASAACRQRARDMTRRWCERALPHAVLSERVISGADPIVGAASLARSRGVDWIVMPAHAGCGQSAVALAQAAGCPVLVARAPTTRSVLLVATAPEHDHYPALRRTARLALALHSPVLVFHDVSSLPATAPLWPQVDALAGPWTLLQREGQGDASGQRLPCIDVLLARGGEPVSSVLERARAEDAELIILSAGSSDRVGRARVAGAVAERALRSVLIVPCGEAATSRAPRALASPSSPRRAPEHRPGRPPSRPPRPLRSPGCSGSLAHAGLAPRWPRPQPGNARRGRARWA